MPRRRWLLGGLGVAAVAAAVVVAATPVLRWRAEVVLMKAIGRLDGVSWPELIAFLDPDHPVFIERVARSGNIHSAIRNPYTTPDDVRRGEELFSRLCAHCHSPTGGGGVGADLTRGVFTRGNSDWALYQVIKRGATDVGMPAHRLDDPEYWRLVAFIRSLASGAAVAEASDSARARLPVVTATRLEETELEPWNWLTYSGALNGRRHSTLAQVDRANVAELRPAWLHQVGGDGMLEASPIVADGTMFVVDPPSAVIALDAADGRELWRYFRPAPPGLKLCCGIVNRGAAVASSRVFVSTIDAHLVALDANRGTLAWETEIADHEEGYSATGAPLAADDKVIVGISGGEWGIRGFLDAYDAHTGERLWRFHTIPAPGEPGGDSWEGDSWRTGGGPTWVTGSYDPELRLVYWGVGNPWPNFQGEGGAGDNLYTNSVVALDVDSGELRWHFQFLPGDVWDYDANAVPVLVDTEIDGVARKLLVMGLKNGFAYALDRGTGDFVYATEISRQTWADSITAEGRPVPRPEALPTRDGALVSPGAGGGANWWPPSYHPGTGLLYIPVTHTTQLFFAGRGEADELGSELVLGSAAVMVRAWPATPAISALDVASGRVAWSYEGRPTSVWPRSSGTLSTATGLLFWSDHRDMLALDAATGEELWRFNTGGAISAAPVTYEVDGRQLVAIVAGRTVVAFGVR